MKRKKLCSILAALCLSVVGALPVSAAARSQNAAVFEAEKYAFYYPASDAQLLHDGHGNFTISGLTGGAISSDDGFVTVISPSGNGSGNTGGSATGADGYPTSPSSWQGGTASGVHTALTVPEGSLLGTLTVRGRVIAVYRGTSNANLLRGAGHFTGTGTWDGNACFAGHNRGPNAWFSDLIRLTPGECITYQTSLGTRMYRVTGTRIVSVNDLSPMNYSVSNRLTLVTCLANRPDVRLIVTAEQVV